MTTPPTNRPMTGEDDDLKLVIAHTIIEGLRVQHPGIEQIDNERGDVWLPGGSTPLSAGCIVDVHSLAQSVEQEVRAALTPGHTDLMISPEAIDAFLDANPAPEPERDGAVERVRKVAPYIGVDPFFDALCHYPEASSDSRVRSFGHDLRRVLSLLEEARGDADRLSGEMDLISGAIGTTEFMDPPDGGDVSLAEQVRRMRAAQLTAERQRDEAVRALEQVKNTTDHRTGYSDLSARRAAHKVSAEALQSIGSDR